MDKRSCPCPGFFMSYDDKGNYNKNIVEKINKIENRLSFWKSRNLTFTWKKSNFEVLMDSTVDLFFLYFDCSN